MMRLLALSPVPPAFAPVPQFVGDEGWLRIWFIAYTPIAIGIVVLMCWAAWKDRTSLPLWLLASSALCIFIEPLGDAIGGIYLPKEAPVQLMTLFGRPMPLMDIYIWIAMAPAFYYGYKLIERGASLRTLAILGAGIGVAEVALELAFVNTHVMLYYSNHAMILGIPVPTIVQNIGLCFVAPVALHLLIPFVQGVRWLLMLFFAPAIVMAYLVPVNVPSYIQINNDVNPLLGWTLGLLSAYLSAQVAYAAVHVPSVAGLRERAGSPWPEHAGEEVCA